MSPVRFVLIIVILYVISLLVSFLFKDWMEILPWAGVLVISLFLFSFIFVVFIIGLAVFYALVKKPVIEKGNYDLDRIKGKRE
jgi:hypothetical protein